MVGLWAITSFISGRVVENECTLCSPCLLVRLPLGSPQMNHLLVSGHSFPPYMMKGSRISPLFALCIVEGYQMGRVMGVGVFRNRITCIFSLKNLQVEKIDERRIASISSFFCHCSGFPSFQVGI